MTYAETLHFLYHSLPVFQHIGGNAYKPGFGNITELEKELGEPHRRFRSVHVAGTNGKGSVSHMTAAVLQAAGYRTGLFTSPHLKDFRERIRVNGEMISEEAVVAFVSSHRKAIDRIRPSFFEITTAIAFDHFARERVDIAVIEVGMGGRLDSTNVIRPLVSVITNISWDHAQFLGDTLEKIAGEKAGIIKEMTPVVIGESQIESQLTFIARAKEFAEVHGDAYVNKDFDELKKAIVADALPKNIAGLQRDLGKYRITYDVWFHESDLHKSGAVDDVIKILMDKGACYKAEDGAIMYRSAQYASKYGVVNRKKDENADGEEEAKDEVLVRANGIPTYFAADIAYHYNKLAVRGFDRAIDIWGADHHGHVARMKGAMDAVGLDGTKLDVVLMQMVNLMRDGKPVRMSKRTGKAITLTDLLDEVPIDSARFFFNQRESSSTLDFDLDLAVRNDSENPVYYVQYAHARICSVLKKLEAAGVTFEGADALDASLLTDPSEQALLRLLSAFPAEIAAAAEKYDPARITRYVIDIATAFHRFYNACRILEADPAVRQCRMALCLAVRSVIRNVLTMFKVTVPESM